MWKCLGYIFSSFAVVLCLQAGESNLVLTIDGTPYSNVTWGTATPASVTLFHQFGVESIALEKLPAEYQNQFNFDPERAQAYRAANPPPSSPLVKMLDRSETANELNKAIGMYCRNYRYSRFEKEGYSAGEAQSGDVERIRWRLRYLYELQKTGHADYRPAIEKFIQGCKRAIERYYLVKKGAPPRAPDRVGGHDLDKNIARRNIDTANAVIESYNKELQRLLDGANGYWTEGQKLKELVDSKGQPKPPPPKPKPTPRDPYLEDMP